MKKKMHMTPVGISEWTLKGSLTEKWENRLLGSLTPTLEINSLESTSILDQGYFDY